MPWLIASEDGLASSTTSLWAQCDDSCYQNSEATSTALTVSDQLSTAFSPNGGAAITVDGVAVKPSLRAASPSGTMTVGLFLGGVLISGTSVTINVSDLPAFGTSANTNCGWVFFKFASPVALTGAAITVGARTSVASQVSLWALATTNWSRMVRSTTKLTAVSGDTLTVVGEWTGAGLMTPRSLTWDLTAAVAVGQSSALTTNPSIGIGKGGTVSASTAAASNFVMNISCPMVVYADGVCNFGTSLNPIPRDSVFQWQANTVTDVNVGIVVRDFGTVIGRGQSRTAAKDVWFCKLTANLAVAGTTANVDTDTGWLSGDLVAFPSTSRTNTEAEERSLNANAGASSFTMGAGGAALHSGASGALPTQGEVLLLTRNLRFVGSGPTVGFYVSVSALSTFDVEWADFRYLGGNVAGKRGIEISTTSAGSFRIRYCTLRDSRTWGIYLASTTTTNLTIQFNTIWNFNTSSTASMVGIFIGNVTAVSATLLVDSNIVSKSLVATTRGIEISRSAGTITNNNCNSCAGFGFIFGDTLGFTLGFTFTGNVAHSNGAAGFQTNVVVKNQQWGTMTAWRNNASGMSFNNNGTSGIFIDTLVLYGNLTQNLLFSSVDDIRVKNLTSNSDASFSTATAIAFNTGSVVSNVVFNDAVFSNSVAHTQDLAPVFSCCLNMTFVDSVSSTGTEFLNPLTTLSSGTVSQIRRNGVAGDNRLYRPNQRNSGAGVLTDSVIFNGSSPSIRVYPGSATANLRLPAFFAAVASGTALTVSVTIRESEVGDGTAWAGFTNQPRLWLRANPAIGILSDTVIATHSGAAGWQTLSGTTAVATDDGVMEFYVDVNGTAGWINIDSFSCVSPSSQGTKYWSGPANGIFVHGEPSSSTQIYMPLGMNGGLNA